MNPSERKGQTRPAVQDELLPDKELQDGPQNHPDQAGAEYGGYGHADNSFGRDAGSSSQEGGQGGGDSGSDSPSAPKTLRRDSDGTVKPSHATACGNGQRDAAAAKQTD
ncbi:hypothetical protein [Polaromonas sp. CG9_12]|uniref:hypothetical protein n=1 Tax=Polaromonas sp. CG_9.11 TaxID=2787730 RepID=UPI0004DDC51C|nr:hypothetical protein [Polaromonas sp. CG_9.11]MBG6077451.1 hypothetical protein [Polaromonas sp. CG_9.11]CDS49021.1 hypothetical protein [Polaromonas sp. CG9_12]